MMSRHVVLLALFLPSVPAMAEETRPIFPLPQGLYTDGETCGAAEIRRNRMYNGFGVSDVIGSTCELKAVEKRGETYAFKADCSEGNGAAAHSWRVDSHIVVSGPDGFTFDGTTYKFCARDDSGRTGVLRHHADEHLPLTAGSYRTVGGKCGALVYWDNPHADLGAIFGGPNFGGDTCTVKRASHQGKTVSFAATCIPGRNAATMRISVRVTVDARSPTDFGYAGRDYRLCKRIIY